MHLRTLRLLHPFPSLLVAGLTVGLLALVDRAQPLRTYAVLGLGMLLYQFAIGVTNDLVDVAEDRRLKPSKPLPRGDLSRGAALGVALGLGLAAALLTATLPLEAWLVGLLGLGCGLVYDLYLKRTALSWLPYSVALPLIPIWVHLAVGKWESRLWWALPLGAVLGLALHLANQAEDAARDSRQGLPALLGARRSRALALALFAAVAAVALLDALERAAADLAGALVGAGVGGAGLATAIAPRAQFAALALGSAMLALLFFGLL